MTHNRGSAGAGRLLGLDAIRGGASFFVVLYHVPESLRQFAGIPSWLDVVFAKGYLGVDAFFVLSGFVISMSVAGANWSWTYMARFAARRSVRLDPAYWAAIAFELFLGWIGVTLLGDEYTFPSAAAVFAHVLYLQGILGFPQISDVFWTLCFEIQFYVGLVGSLTVARKLRDVLRIEPKHLLATAFGIVYVVSLLTRNGVLSSLNEGFAIVRAFQFGLGVLAFLFATQRISLLQLLPLALLALFSRVAAGELLEAAVMSVTVMVCVLSVRVPKTNAVLESASLQFLGAISYSLYLFHASIVGRGGTVVLAFARQRSSSMLAFFGIVFLVMASIVVSYLAYRVIESPTHRLSKRIAV